MKLKLTRDEARTIQQHFFPYMMQRIEMEIRQAAVANNEPQQMLSRVVRCIAMDIKRKFDLKLIGFAQKFQFDLKEREAIILCRSLLKQPIDEKNVWMISLRDRIINVLYKALSEPGQM